MSTLYRPLEPQLTPLARTNILKLPGLPLDLLTKLLKPLEGGVAHINFSTTMLVKESAEDYPSYYRRVDKRIREIISGKMSLARITGIHYNRMMGARGTIGFFYLSETPDTPERVSNEIQRLSLNINNVIKALLGLRLKMDFLNDAANRYEIAPVEFNAELYIGVMPISKPSEKRPGVLFDALAIDLCFTAQQELAIKVVQTVFRCTPAVTTTSVLTTGTFMCHWGGKTYVLDNQLDARRFKSRPYMEFSISADRKVAKPWQGYEHSRNCHLTDCLNRLQRIFDQDGIGFERIPFQATHRVEDFLSPTVAQGNPLVVIDAFESYPDESHRELFWGHIREVLKPAQIVRVSDTLPPGELPSKDCSYLVLNEMRKGNGSSILDRTSGALFNTFWQALGHHKITKEICDFDYYTRMKIERFNANRDFVCQGYNLEQTFKADPATGDLKLIPMKGHTLEKIGYELWLKESVFHRRLIRFPEANFTKRQVELLSCRRDANRNCWIVVVEASLEGTEIRLGTVTRYDNQSTGRFNYRYPNLGKSLGKATKTSFDAIYDGGFMLHDVETGVWLNAYNSIRVPSIIGNALFDNVERHFSGEGVNRSNKPTSTPLPYYITPTEQGQRHFLFLEDHGLEGVLYFVSKANPTPASIEKQNLVNNVLLYDREGEIIPAFGHPMTELFFSTFTYDLLRLRESAKTSVLQKIAELHLEN